MHKAPHENLKFSKFTLESIILAIVINVIAIHILFDISSLKNSKAIYDIATISKLFNKELVEEVVFDRPTINNIGANTFKIIFPIVYGKSFFANSSFLGICFLLIMKQVPILMPAPKYKRPAKKVGGLYFNKHFENGILTAYNSAASTAYIIAVFCFCFTVKPHSFVFINLINYITNKPCG